MSENCPRIYEHEERGLPAPAQLPIIASINFRKDGLSVFISHVGAGFPAARAKSGSLSIGAARTLCLPPARAKTFTPGTFVLVEALAESRVVLEAL